MELEIMTGSYDGLVQGFSIDALDPENKGLQRKFHEKSHSGCVRTVACGGKYLATGSTDETIKLYDTRKHTEIGTLLQQEGSITRLTFHKDRLLLSASEDGSICVWSCGESWDCLATLSGHKYAVACVSVHPSGKLALSVGKDRTLRTWELTNFRQVFRLRLPKAAELVLWSPIGNQYVLAVETTITVYDVSTGESVASFDVEKWVNCFTFIKDNVLAVGSECPSIDLYSTTTGTLLARLEGHTNRVKDLALSPTADLLFSASSDGTIKTWKLQEPWSKSVCLGSMDTRSRLTCLAVISPITLLKELKLLRSQDPVSEKREELSNEAQACERDETTISTSCCIEATEEKRRHKVKDDTVLESSSSQGTADTCASGTKNNKLELNLAKRVSRSRMSLLVPSGVKAKQGRLSRKRLLIRKERHKF